jgi:hypothetical protein
MAGDQEHTIKGDRALKSGVEDKLGFREVAKRIATSLVDRASEDGLVVGVEGEWGSGKSSLLFLIRDELGKIAKSKAPTVIDFRPWLIGNRDALISSLFGEISRQLDLVALYAGKDTPVTVAEAREAAKALRSFISALGKTGAAIEVAGDASGFGPIKYLGRGVKALGELAGNKPVPPQLSEKKDKLVKSLRKLDHRFIVTIDDVDRLEPAEVIEILRLVRSVVDLPNVIYVLCYDSDILAHSIEEAAKVKNGRLYMEKIVQLTVMVPKPEPFQLRQWFADDLQLLASAKDDEELSRLKIVVEYEGGRRFRTARSVVRALDAIRFFWPPLREERADLADLVWLQLIKDGNPSLYRWIEGYCGLASAISLGTARVDSTENARELDALHATVPKGHFDELMYRHYFARQLPGVEVDGNGLKIFQRVIDRERDEALRKRRLASPDHYRLYFSLVGPSHALTQEDFATVWEAAHAGAEEIGAVLLVFHDKQAGGTLTKADLLLERLKSGAFKVLSPEQCEHILISLSDVMDEAYRRHPFDQFSVSSVWDRAERLMPSLLSLLEPSRRREVVATIFSRGVAVGWLTSLFRHETFGHGRYGNKQVPSDERLFTEAEFNLINDLMLGRYGAMSGSDLLSCPNPLNVLFAWRQGGDEQAPRRLVDGIIASDEGLIQLLEKLTSTIHSSSRGNVQVLTKENISPFMVYESVHQRIYDLKDDNLLGARAQQLAFAFEEAN